MKTENWFKWDVDFLSDINFRFYLRNQADKASAIGCYLYLVSELYKSKDGWIEQDEIFLGVAADALGWTSEEVRQAIAKQIEARLFIVKQNSFASNRVICELEKRKSLSEKRSEAGRKGGSASTSSKQLLSKAKQTEAKPSRVDKSRVDKSRLDLKRETPAPELIQISKLIRMTADQHKTLITDFGTPLLIQELKEADIWIENAQTKNARAYRKPEHNHYLFMRNWLKDKRLKTSYNGSANGARQSNAEQIVETVNRFIEDELLKEKMQHETN